MSRPLLVLALLLVAPAAHAEEPRAMGLGEAIAYAKSHHPEVRAALARVNAAGAAAEVPRAQWQPTVGVTAQLFAMTANNTTGTYVSPGNYMDVPRIGGTRGLDLASASWRPYGASFAGVGGTQELFDFGRIAAGAAAADAQTDVARARADQTVVDVTFDVEEAYFAVLAAKWIVTASSDAFERSRVHRDLAQAGVRAGLRSPIELTRAEADLTRFDMGRIRAAGGLVTAQTVLAATVGVPDAAIDALPVPREAADAPALAAAIDAASARDPRMREALAALRAEEKRTTAIGAELRPDLSLTATLSGRAGGAPPSGNGVPAGAGGLLPDVPNWDVGVVLAWPLFDGVISARRDASRAAEQVQREEIERVRAGAIAKIRVAYLAFDLAKAAIPGLERAVAAARANYAQADARFGAGLATSVELADAEALRTDAEIQLALGHFQLARARSEVGRALSEGR